MSRRVIVTKTTTSSHDDDFPSSSSIRSSAATKESFGDLQRNMESELEKKRHDWEHEVSKMQGDFFELKTPSTGKNTVEVLSLEGPTKARVGQRVDVVSTDRSVVDSTDPKHFKVCFDVRDYKPEEINVRAEGRKVTVSAKKEVRELGGSSSTRQFNRQVDLPRGVDPDKVTSYLGTDGVLAVEAPIETFSGGEDKDRSAHLFSSSSGPYQQSRIVTSSKSGGGFEPIIPESLVSKSFSSGYESAFRSPTSSSSGGSKTNSAFVVETDYGQKLKLNVDIGTGYKPDDIIVSPQQRGRSIRVNAKHEETMGGSTSSREFSRDFGLPYEIEPRTLKALLGNDGVVYIAASLATNKDHDRLMDSILLDMPPGSKPCIIQNAGTTQASGLTAQKEQRVESSFSSTTSSSPSKPSVFKLDTPTVVETDYGQKLKFSVNVGPEYKPDDIVISPQRAGRSVRVNAKHVENIGGRSSTSEFSKDFVLPAEIESRTLKAVLGTDGVVYIAASLASNRNHDRLTDSILSDMPVGSKPCIVQTTGAGAAGGGGGLIISTTSTTTSASPMSTPQKEPSWTYLKPNSPTIVETEYGQKLKLPVDIGYDYKPTDITVSLQRGRTIRVNARHEETIGERSSTREFSKDFIVKEDLEPRTLKAVLGTDGVIYIAAGLAKNKNNDRLVDAILLDMPAASKPCNVQSGDQPKEQQRGSDFSSTFSSTTSSSSSAGTSTLSSSLNSPNVVDTEYGKKFRLTVDIGSGYKPNDIVVSVQRGRTVRINAKHEETIGGSTSTREFSKDFIAPADLESRTLRAVLGTDGVVYVAASLASNKDHDQLLEAILIDMPPGSKPCVVKR